MRDDEEKDDNDDGENLLRVAEGMVTVEVDDHDTEEKAEAFVTMATRLIKSLGIMTNNNFLDSKRDGRTLCFK